MAEAINLTERANLIQKKLKSPEHMLGKGLLQPANNTNSGPRKIMQGIHKEQAIQLIKPEAPILMTGYENQYGKKSSYYITADRDYRVLAKIYKNPTHYWILIEDMDNKIVDCIERVGYDYITENYGYTLNNSYLDNLTEGSFIHKNDPIVMPSSFDLALNKCDGVNLTTIYLAIAKTTEDPIVLSQSAADKLKAALYSKIRIVINDNDIPLNLYGDDTKYKSFPDIGEPIINKLLCGIRRERKDDEALYCQSVQHLKELMPSDATYIVGGTVVDVDVYCNNPESLDLVYNSQIAKYHKENIKFCKDLIDSTNKAMSRGKYTMSYELSKLYSTCKRVLDGDMYIIDKVFNNIVVDIVVREDKALIEGDKITDRYGGKGVISYIVPDEDMPIYYRNGEAHHVEAIYNSSTMVNRENPGQSFETEMIYVGDKIVEKIIGIMTAARKLDDPLALDEALSTCEHLIYQFYMIVSPEEATEYANMIKRLDSRLEHLGYMESVMDSGHLYMVIPPISGNIGLDTLEALYNAFPWVEMEYYYINMRDSNGHVRQVRSIRPIIIGKKYIYRLKQISEEKFSATSLSSTNLRGENTKTKANKQHRVAYSNTPVRLGNMEITNLLEAAGTSLVLALSLMVLSLAPIYRRDVYQLMVGDPFNPTINFENNAARAVNRSAEIVMVYLVILGLEISFEKLPLDVKPAFTEDVVVVDPTGTEPLESPIMGIPYYLQQKNLEEFVKIYQEVNKENLPEEVIWQENGQYRYSPAFEHALEKTLELANKCGTMGEFLEQLQIKQHPDLEQVLYQVPLEESLH